MLGNTGRSVLQMLKDAPEHWGIYLATVISDGDITTILIFSDRGGERVEEKARAAFPGASVAISVLDELETVYDIFGM